MPHGFQPQEMPDGSKVIRNQHSDIAMQMSADNGFFFTLREPADLPPSPAARGVDFFR
jgi:hypothetical protein